MCGLVCLYLQHLQMILIDWFFVGITVFYSLFITTTRSRQSPIFKWQLGAHAALMLYQSYRTSFWFALIMNNNNNESYFALRNTQVHKFNRYRVVLSIISILILTQLTVIINCLDDAYAWVMHDVSTMVASICMTKVMSHHQTHPFARVLCGGFLPVWAHTTFSNYTYANGQRKWRTIQ